MRIRGAGYMRVILLTTFLCIPISGAFASGSDLPIRVTLIQCGPREDIKKSCRRNEKCCVFLENDQGEDDDDQGDIQEVAFTINRTQE